jgi:tripartite-type tricarboxylate transporter receptor subunit TctC
LTTRLQGVLARIEKFHDELEEQGYAVRVDITLTVTGPASTPEERTRRLVAVEDASEGGDAV